MFDVSIVTDALRDIVIDALATSPLFAPAGAPFSVGVTGQHPEMPAPDTDCDLNLYLFHLCEDRQLKNSFWSQASISGQPPGPARQPIAFEPLCLDLYFLLSARSQTSFVQEQQVLSVALRAFHERPKVTLATPTPAGDATSEITLTMEAPTVDELSRLWQALSTPLRASAEYRAAVVLITPETGLTAQPKPTQWTVLAAPSDDPDATPQLFGTSRRVTYTAPDGVRTFDQTPASAAPGQDFLLRGRGLHDTDTVLLVDDADTTTDISAWRVALTTPYPTIPAGGVPLILRPPTSAPPAGRYRVRVNDDDVPFAIAPAIDPSVGPAIGAAAGVYAFGASHIPAADAELRFGSALLARAAAGPPNVGEWFFDGATITCRAPATLPPGTYAIRLRAAGVEADPALWAVVA